MNKHIKLFSIISYITWIGWIIAFVFGDRNDRVLKQHINQALALNIIGILVSAGNRIGGVIEYVAGLIALGALILTIMGIWRAAHLSDEPLPVIGNFRIF
jgi:uncharacterized membrane protein